MKFNLPPQLLFDQMPGCIGWKDLQFKYQGGNQNLLHEKGLHSTKELIDLCDEEINPTCELNPIFREQDLIVIQGKSVETILDDQNRSYYLGKSPLYDEKNIICGLIYFCRPLLQTPAIKQISAADTKLGLTTTYYNLTCHINKFQFSNRELECLFLTIRGKTAKEIGFILKLSKRTVETYIESLRCKAGCQNKSELIVIAMQHGYDKHMPKTLLNII